MANCFCGRTYSYALTSIGVVVCFGPLQNDEPVSRGKTFLRPIRVPIMSQPTRLVGWRNKDTKLRDEMSFIVDCGSGRSGSAVALKASAVFEQSDHTDIVMKNSHRFRC